MRMVIVTNVYKAFLVYKRLLRSSTRLVLATTSQGVQERQRKPRDVGNSSRVTMSVGLLPGLLISNPMPFPQHEP